MAWSLLKTRCTLRQVHGRFFTPNAHWPVTCIPVAETPEANTVYTTHAAQPF